MHSSFTSVQQRTTCVVRLDKLLTECWCTRKEEGADDDHAAPGAFLTAGSDAIAAFVWEAMCPGAQVNRGRVPWEVHDHTHEDATDVDQTRASVSISGLELCSPACT